MKYLLLALGLLGALLPAAAQVKTVIEDFEAYADGQRIFEKEGIFFYGDVQLMADQTPTSGYGYSGKRAMQVKAVPKSGYGGWGKGLGLFKELDVNSDYFNFYVLHPAANKTPMRLKILLEDDDNGDGIFQADKDDQWAFDLSIPPSDDWQVYSLPLAAFYLDNTGGDGVFNVNYKGGQLLTLIFDLPEISFELTSQESYFDFLSFSKGPFDAPALFDLPATEQHSGAVTGAWSEEGKSGRLEDIHRTVEDMYGCMLPGKLGIVSFYKPMSIDDKKQPNFLPEVGQINQLIERGYLPMITFEVQHKASDPSFRQPNLYSITEGWYDHYFAAWAQTIAQAKGEVLVRLLHEFNGDWYPWCVANNDKNPELYQRAFRHIVDIFRSNGANNMRFVWCPNSISSPQQSWNDPAAAYPGDEYVDFIGVDIFNGAGQAGIPQWRSFRHELSDFYYLATQRFGHKPLIICETGSRERFPEERGHYPDKAEWLRAMAECLKGDMQQVEAVVWFNETEAFRLDSSTEAFGAFFKYFRTDPYFKRNPSTLIKD